VGGVSYLAGCVDSGTGASANTFAVYSNNNQALVCSSTDPVAATIISLYHEILRRCPDAATLSAKVNSYKGLPSAMAQARAATGNSNLLQIDQGFLNIEAELKSSSEYLALNSLNLIDLIGYQSNRLCVTPATYEYLPDSAGCVLRSSVTQMPAELQIEASLIWDAQNGVMSPDFSGPGSIGVGGATANAGFEYFTLTNTGDVAITNLAATAFTTLDTSSVPAVFLSGAGFGFDGGNFPGTTGNCGSTLPAHSQCTVGISLDTSSLSNWQVQTNITSRVSFTYGSGGRRSLTLRATSSLPDPNMAGGGG
jgi:hypothetical protein